MSLTFRTPLLTSAVALIPLAIAAQAHGQAIERHLPETPKNAPAQIVAPNAVPAEQDATPIGPNLRAIVLLGPQETVHASANDGVAVGALGRLNDGGMDSVLRPFIGKPLSRKLIAEIEAAIARYYRDLDYPFVSLSTPEQEITGGVLQIRVVEFHTGKVNVTGAKSDKEGKRIRNKVGLKTGDTINARDLTYDLDWVNHYPFRNVEAVFSPGDTLGVTDLTLAAREAKPWQVYGGYSNDGSPSTSFDRYFAGGAVGGLLGPDSVLSVQATASRDALAGDKNPHYRSAALSYTLPLGRRGQIEASADAVTTFQPGNPFSVRLKAGEGSLGYRFAVSDLYGDTGETDFRFGVEAKHQTGITYFGSLAIFDTSVEIYQAYLGYHHSGKDAMGASTFDVVAHLSPGNINRGNSDEQAVLYSQGRLKNATYGYVTANYSRFTPLGGDLVLRTQATAQLASAALPRTEQAGLGGSSLVRGYTLDDGAFDSALVIRNELRLRPRSVGTGSQLSPFAFVDAGYGRDIAARTHSALASAGAGAEMQLTRHVVWNVTAAWALTPDHVTRAGSLLAHTNLSVAF